MATNKTSNVVPRVLTEREAAEYLRVSVAFLRSSRQQNPTIKAGPPFVRIAGRTVRYLEPDLVRWLERGRVTLTDEARS